MMNKCPVRYLYRAMRCDMDDLVYRYELIMDMPIDTIEFKDWTLRTVKECSHCRSSYLHASKSLASAYRWHSLAQMNISRLEMADDQCMIRIDLVRWFCEGDMKPDQVDRARDFHREPFLYYSCNQKCSANLK